MVGFILLHGVLPVVVFALAFLIEKKPWRGYKSFADWEARIVKKLKGSGDWVRKQLQSLKKWVWKQVLALWAKRPPLKPLYIVLATFIGFVILYLFVILCLEIYSIEWQTIATDDSKTRNYAIAFIGLVSGFGALFGVYLAIQRTDESKRTNEIAIRKNEIADDTNKITIRQNEIADIESKTARSQADITGQQSITERLNRAIENLDKNDTKGEPAISMRLGMIYDLERIAQYSIRDHIQIMDMLCFYIRNNSPRTTKSTKKDDPLREDIQTALTIIGRRGAWTDGEKSLAKEAENRYRIDLQSCDLRGALLSRANLRGTRFLGSNMNHATFDNADLSNTWFEDAILNGAWFGNAKMDRAWAWECDFSKCRELTQKQLDVMYCGTAVKIPNGLTRPKHWPTDELPFPEFQEAYWKWEMVQADSYLHPLNTKAPT